MNKIPFEYGSIAENEYFIDRIEDRRDLKTFLGGGINVIDRKSVGRERVC